ncbi:tyrosine-type recombinase/integrase [Actinoplanes aureus]|uniref:Tyrosine-type recombinase/integrase n=1 Tax=Actinoplanes aureus TaxID=2792083 RepID=A0A931CDB2_9ACTN|nr:site-specific integrase [Actinoplanes aureus]MBG0565372.1 tyrosine-type recombinase/integrase [Actinoplanes aureus]
MPTSGLFKQCGCRDAATGKRLLRRCARLTERGHGSWYYRCYVRDLWGKARQVSRGGFSSQAAARHARVEVLGESWEQLASRTWTIAQWLRYWLTTRRSIRPTTLRVYTQHVETYLIPGIGTLRLNELTGRHLTALFTDLAAGTTPAGRPRSAATLHRVRATLRAAYNAAIRDGLVTANPARHVEMPPARRPHATVWTDSRVARWEEDGTRPAVAVWTTEQVTRFLDSVADDPLYPLWWLIALRGLRRGEAAGLRWSDIDLDRRQLTITSQRTTLGYQVLEGPPKSAASRRTVALDRQTVTVLRAHLRRQRAAYLAAGRTWPPFGYVFTRPDGQPYHPNYFTHRLHYLIGRTDLPPVRLHDLRHGAASLAHTAGADLKTVQDQLGHASIVLTADTYTSVLPVAHHRAAEATARLVLTTARRTRAKITCKSRHRTPGLSTPASTTPTPANPPDTRRNAGQRRSRRRRRA